MKESDANTNGTYQAVRIGDVADWRLLLWIGEKGIGAWLRHTDPTRKLELLFRDSWKDAGDTLLSKIESAIYDHPQVLDDFTADVAITAQRSIWVPTQAVADDCDEALRLYSQVYPALAGDVMAEEVDEATCLFSLVPGLNAFLGRTLPGARIHSHLAVMARRFRERSADMPRVYADIRDGEVDFIAFDRRDLLMGATHRWHHPDDIRYHIFNIMQVFNLDPKHTQVSLSGDSKLRASLVAELRKDIDYVMMTMLPSIGATADLPLPLALLLRK